MYNPSIKHMKNKIIIALSVVIGIAIYAACSYVPEFNGIDISHHNRVNWDKVRENEAIKFCYIKATEGKSFRDPMCAKHAKKAHENGLHVGLYHYFRTDVTPEKQFENFKRVYDKVPSNLIPVIDVEKDGNDFSNADFVNDRLDSLTHLFEQEYNCKPIIYLGSWCCLKVIPSIYDCPLWLRFIKGYHFIPNTAIKQVAIIDHLDMNYCKDIDDIILK